MFALCLHITIIIVIKCRTRKLILGLSAQFPRRSICCRLLEKTARKNSSASEPTLPFKIQSLSLPIYNSNKMMSCLHFTEVKLLPNKIFESKVVGGMPWCMVQKYVSMMVGDDWWWSPDQLLAWSVAPILVCIVFFCLLSNASLSVLALALCVAIVASSLSHSFFLCCLQRQKIRRCIETRRLLSRRHKFFAATYNKTNWPLLFILIRVFERQWCLLDLHTSTSSLWTHFFCNSEVWPQELLIALWQMILGCF